MNNIITFKGKRGSVSATGNVEWFSFTITSERNLPQELIEQLVNSHECGGQDWTYEYEIQDGIHIYNGKSTRYSD